jgi:hypothetical protein
MIPWIIIAVGVLLLYSSLKEGAKAWPSAAGAIVIGIGVVALGKSFGWLAIGAGVLGLLFLLIGLKAVTRLLAGAALIGMVLGGIVSIDFDDDDKTEASADDTPATSTTTAPVPPDELELSSESIAELAERLEGFHADEVAMGGDVDTSLNDQQERSETSSFLNDGWLDTNEEVGTFLSADTRESQAARGRVEEALRDVPADCGINRALRGEGYFPLQFLVDSQILGTTYLVGDVVQQAQNWRAVHGGDMLWLFADCNGVIHFGATVRADCGNPNFERARPVRPDTPDVPPVETPPGEVCPFNPALPVDSPNCLKPKDPSQDVLLNPDVPDQVKGPGTTPVGTDPGPPTPACDTPTGYCPGSEPTTTTTQPSGGSGGGGSGGGTTTTVPSCGQAGQPSCDNTGVSPPTTEAPPPAPPTTESPDDTIPSP